MLVLFFILGAMRLLAPGADHLIVAREIAAVVLDEAPLFKDDADHLKTAALVVAVAFRESSFRTNVRSAQDDHCLMQIHGRTDVDASVETCIRVGIWMLRDSMRACPEHPIAVYASGPSGCTNARAQRISRDRMALAARLVREVRP